MKKNGHGKLALSKPEWSNWETYSVQEVKHLQTPQHWALWQWFNKTHYVVQDEQFGYMVDAIPGAEPTDAEVDAFKGTFPQGSGE